ncbi:MAG: hypothetical protein NWE90_08020 [Candidatus Bathyarchaeota archaeon]|nr:hypothetical protein [Candidatus Bathyarchaeota archaeon]
MNPKRKVSCMETVSGLKYVEDGHVVHGTLLLRLLTKTQEVILKSEDTKLQAQELERS